MPENARAPQQILAFDYGTLRIGVAIGQAITGTANPLKPLKARDGIPNWDAIAALIAEWQPDTLLVGIPLNMDGTDSEIAQRARKFCNRLNGRFQLPVLGMDERLSTFDAKSQIMAEQQSNQGKGRKGISVDSTAAKLILESWFNQTNTELKE